MSWTDLSPVDTGRGKAMVNMSIQKKASHSKATVWVSFADTFMDEFDRPQACRAQFGGGDHAGMVRLTFDNDGPFKLNYLGRGGARIVLPLFHPLTEAAKAGLPASIVEKNSNKGQDIILGEPTPPEFVVVKVPEDWLQAPPARGGVLTPEPVSIPAPRPVARRTIQEPSEPAGWVQYLRKKGHKIEPLAGGRYLLNGETMIGEALTAAVNHHRKKEGLPEFQSFQQMVDALG